MGIEAVNDIALCVLALLIWASIWLVSLSTFALSFLRKVAIYVLLRANVLKRIVTRTSMVFYIKERNTSFSGRSKMPTSNVVVSCVAP